MQRKDKQSGGLLLRFLCGLIVAACFTTILPSLRQITTTSSTSANAATKEAALHLPMNARNIDVTEHGGAERTASFGGSTRNLGAVVEASSPSTTTAPARGAQVADPTKNNERPPMTAPPTASPTAAPTTTPHLVLYSHARRDRSGAALLDALLSHAYSFSKQDNNATSYGGICDTASHVVTPYSTLLSFWGLDHVIPWPACPKQQQKQHQQIVQKEGEASSSHKVIEGFVDGTLIYQLGTSLLTDEWLERIRSLRHHQSNSSALSVADDNDDDSVIRIAVHIRRGDISPCWVSSRYLNNEFFLELIPQVVANVTATNPNKEVQVTIYTEPVSFEPLDVFLQSNNNHNYTVVVGGNITSVWAGMDRAHVLIQSPSTFSMIPALLSKHIQRVIHVPFKEWSPPLPSWELVNKTLLEQNKRWISERTKNKKEYCNIREPKFVHNYTDMNLTGSISNSNNGTTPDKTTTGIDDGNTNDQESSTVTMTTKEGRGELILNETVEEKNSSSSKPIMGLPTNDHHGAALPQYLQNATRLFTKSRLDRTGMIVLDALMGHAYATRYNLSYGGVCGPSRHYHMNFPALYDVWGLQTVVPLIVDSCAFMNETDVFIQQQGIVEREWHHQLFTPEWIEQVRRARQPQEVVHGGASVGVIQLGVHIRRGDVSPCRWNQRYLNNDFFLHFIPQVISNLTMSDPTATSVNVTIYTEDLAFEPLEVFEERGYNLVIGGDLFETWRHMDRDIDVMILSPSSFSMVPALLSRRIKRVYAPPFERWKTPLGGWEPVNLTLVQESKDWMGRRLHREVKHKYCGEGNKPLHLYNYTHRSISATISGNSSDQGGGVSTTLLPPYLRNNETLPGYLNQTKRLFSHARTDRSGAAMLNAFLAHAYAYHYGIPFEGICGYTTHGETHEQAIQTWGLSHILKWQSCPKDSIADTYVDRAVAGLRGVNTAMLTPEWVDVIRSLRNITDTPAARRKEGASITTNVAVHVRRGDISPCLYYRRYYPNSFYLDLIDEAIIPNEPNANITIYTEDDAFESVQEFLDRGFRVVCGGNLNQVWAEMDTRYDVLITSASTFSYIPAILSPNLRRVIYVQNEDWKPLQGWESVDRKIIDRAKANVLAMRKEHCQKFKDGPRVWYNYTTRMVGNETSDRKG